MVENSTPEWAKRMRAAGYVVTLATRDTLPDPEYVLPARSVTCGICSGGFCTVSVEAPDPRLKSAKADCVPL